ncbi:hypothetical protein [Candidatus Solincola tengchongensis]|uniref:hypothetical protein n=1 Tax=Candidatus Solincola tengchongensis TaxID=2900693 RepID=UPI00257A3F90|nr:hypothetical protein [Candidatus Solincola tengchongensis]
MEKTRQKLLLMHASTVSGNTACAIDFLLHLGGERLRHLDAEQLLDLDHGNDPFGGKAYLEEAPAAMIGARFSGLEGAALMLPSPYDDGRYIAVAAAGTASLREPLRISSGPPRRGGHGCGRERTIRKLGMARTSWSPSGWTSTETD